MLVRIGKLRVDVVDAKCPKRDCYCLGFDKGSFTPGRGYTRYHAKEKPVCGQRFYRGCPTNSVCPICRSANVEPPGTPCDRPKCEGIRILPGNP